MCTLEEKEKESKMRTQTVRYRVYEEWITTRSWAATVAMVSYVKATFPNTAGNCSRLFLILQMTAMLQKLWLL